MGKAELVKSSLSRDGVPVITAPRGEEAPKQLHTETVENKMEKVLNPASWDEERRRESAFNDRRGISAFDDFRRDSAVDEKRIESVFDDLRRDSAFNTQSSLWCEGRACQVLPEQGRGAGDHSS